MKKPVEAKDIWKYIPHRPPMIWIDRITDWGATEGASEVDVRTDAHYMSPEGLRPSSCIEIIAQTYGLVWTCHVIYNVDPNSKGMSVAMLAAFKDVKFAPPDVMRTVKEGDRLICRISKVRWVGPIASFRGEVWLGETLLAEAGMRTFSQ